MEKIINFSKSLSTGKSVVNAKELHRSLKVNKNYFYWIQEKIKKLELVENQDYTLIYFDDKDNRIPLSEGRNIHRIDCVLTLRSAARITTTHRHNAEVLDCITAKALTELDEVKISTAEILELEAEAVENEDIPLEYPDLISSTEIASATKKMHKHVMRDIEVMCAQGDIVVVQSWTTIDTQHCMVIEHMREVNQGMGRTRNYKEYLLNKFAAEVLALGYDVKRRMAMVSLFYKMKTALEERPTKTVMIDVKNIGFNEAGKMFGTNGRGVNHTLKKAGYLRPNNKPYEKHVLQGYFAWEYYNEKYSAKHLTITPVKGMSLLQELYNKNVNLPEVIKQQLPVTKQQSFVTGVQVDPKILDMISDNNKVSVAITNFMIMVKAGKNNKIEEAKYMDVIKEFHVKYSEKTLHFL